MQFFSFSNENETYTFHYEYQFWNPFFLVTNSFTSTTFQAFRTETSYYGVQNISCTCSIHYITITILYESLIHAK